MLRPLVLIAGATICLVPHAARAQAYAPSWGQPAHLDSRGRPVGGAPLSEVEVRAYAGTGRWADGRRERPRVYVPAPAPGYGEGRRRLRDHDGPWRARGDAAGRSRGQGYRDEWGYNDDRPDGVRRGWRVRRPAPRHDCGCGDVYLYDR
jgi:hypothetical protein